MNNITETVFFITPHAHEEPYLDSVANYVRDENSIPVGNYTLSCVLQKSKSKDGMGKMSLAWLTVTANKEIVDPNQQEMPL
jgi:hypothetical protein